MHGLVLNTIPEMQEPSVKQVPARDDKNFTKQLVCE